MFAIYTIITTIRSVQVDRGKQFDYRLFKVVKIDSLKPTKVNRAETQKKKA